MANEISNYAIDDICLPAVPLTYGNGAIAELASVYFPGDRCRIF
ncbi:hypothetical protein [uncultured Duncaniella sp.]|nr:hypothetical protein [uncultured Duncaniella sp.]